MGHSSTEVLTALVAGYAALLSTLVAGWQVWSNRSRVKVRLKFNMAMHGANDVDGDRIVLFHLMNPRDHPVKVTGLSVMPSWWRRKRGDLSAFIPHPLPMPAPGPFTVPARDGVTLYIYPDVLSSYVGRRVRAVITTGAGNTFRSPLVEVPHPKAAVT